jgi:prepilin-type N-terminal cleavage/methylation domain-containing protein
MTVKSEKGFSLIEVLVSLAILGLLAVGFLVALATSSRAAVQIDRMDTARALAQSQMEFVKEQPFNLSGQYLINNSVMPQYPGYSVLISSIPATNRDSLIQKITVSITNSGKTIATLQDYKVKK